MSTLDDVLALQKQYHILQAPTTTIAEKVVVAATASTLNVTLKNNTTSSNCYAYVTGLDINKNNAVFFLQSDGVTPYYPSSPSGTQQALAKNCHIKLGAPGTSKVITVPQLVGGRVWLCKDSQLTFKLNPGPAVVEPSVTNPSDPNYNLWWSFAEFTFNSFQVFANITYVDFVGMPIALTLVNGNGAVQTVPGIPSNGVDAVCAALTAQDAKDGAGWSKLIVKNSSGANLRALSPNSGIVMQPTLFNNYYQPYVNAVWAKYASETLTVNTQVQWGQVTGKVTSGKLTFGSVGAFPQPSAKDIFSCSSGAFAGYATNGDEMANITTRLAAAFNRSTLLVNSQQPTNEVVSQYYQNTITNHYSRIVHSVCPDGKGYAFPYDDVDSSDATNVAGTVADSDPKTLTISFGGLTAAAKREPATAAEHARSGGQGRQQVSRSGGGRIGRRGLEWLSAEEEKAQLALRDEETGLQMVEMSADDANVDLEKGLGLTKLGAELRHGLVLAPGQQLQQQQQRGGLKLEKLEPAAVQAKLAAVLEKIEDSPAYRYAKPAVDVALKAVVAVLQLSVKSLVSRIVVVALLLFCSFMLGMFGRPEFLGEAGLPGLGDA